MKTKNKVVTVLFFSFLGIVVLGTLFHFAFEFSGCNTLVGAFTPVNESIWEHLKLILIPSIIVGFFEYFTFGKYYDNYFFAKAMGAFFGMLVMLLGYYTYTGIIGRDYFAANIFLFILSAVVSVYSEYKILTSRSKFNGEKASVIGIIIITALLIINMFFTFNPPMLELFRDPLSHDFGISDYRCR